MTQVTVRRIDVGQPRAKDADPKRLAALLGRLSRPLQAARRVPHVGTWVGLGLVSLGAGLLVLAWGKTAALTTVALQLPYVVSAGFSGLGLIVVGLTVVSMSAKQEDARERARQAEELHGLLTQLRTALEADVT